MYRWMRRALLLLLAAALLASLVAPMASAEEDWRSKLRDAFGLSDNEESYVTEAVEDSADDEAEDEAAYDDEPITDPQGIVNYLDAYGKLPWNFLTKSEAKQLGWDSSYNYVGDVAPGMSIGGDRFGNYEGSLPDKKGRKWYECDVGYQGKKRNARRLLYSSDGLYYYTDDHYKTFKQMYPEGKR